ncbi:nuclear transport factor 2-like [Physella acuta]|uniref:nuclear transport factor 2-like n=1 Tax=Physella acuta TaxID=109671 RepID=UPI0027DB6303|nr:nuclear transport factor 2-like [Physella acuta]
MNPNFDTIGKQFVEQYYAVFDNKDTRSQVAVMYHPANALLTFEGQQFHGINAIAEKMKNIPIDNMFRQITTIDCQPTIDGGVLVNVIGQLKNNSEHDKVMGFSQTFVLKPADNSFFIFHDIFRLVIHNM